MQSATWLLLGGLIFAVDSPDASEGPRETASAVADSASNQTVDVDFHRDVAPILARHCYVCHGEDEQKGGLRLDRRTSAELGGQSGAPILGGDEESNAVWLRVASSNPAVRMPKDDEPLSADELATLRRWVAAGTPWPEDTEENSKNYSSGRNEFALWYNRFEANHGDTMWTLHYFGLALLPILIVVLMVERAKAARKSRTIASSGRWASVQRFLSRVPRSLYLVVVFVIVYSATVTVARGIVVKLERENSEMRAQLTQFNGTEVVSVFGDPPVPFRPGHVSRLGGEYYRGNCERNAALFNNGNYQTAIMRVALCGADKQPLQRGDAVEPGSQLFVHLDMERAPFAAEQLFTEAIMKQIFLSDRYVRAGDDDPPSAVPLETVEEGDRWSAFYPLPVKAKADGTTKGLIYIYRRTGAEGSHSVPHYGISYDLTFAGGAIGDSSELWMAPLYLPSGVQPPHPTKLPLCQWFDDRPLPVIVGGNTSDPKLLGVGEHLGDGAGENKSTGEGGDSVTPSNH